MTCETLPGTVGGVAKSALCQQVVECVRASECTTNMKTEPYTAVDCFCGNNADVDACLAGTVASATGACKEIIATASETQNVPDIAARFTDATFASGAAFQLLQCDSRSCVAECRF